LPRYLALSLPPSLSVCATVLTSSYPKIKKNHLIYILITEFKFVHRDYKSDRISNKGIFLSS
jgi:hypothetical protein